MFVVHGEVFHIAVKCFSGPSIYQGPISCSLLHCGVCSIDASWVSLEKKQAPIFDPVFQNRVCSSGGDMLSRMCWQGSWVLFLSPWFRFGIFHLVTQCIWGTDYRVTVSHFWLCVYDCFCSTDKDVLLVSWIGSHAPISGSRIQCGLCSPCGDVLYGFLRSESVFCFFIGVLEQRSFTWWGCVFWLLSSGKHSPLWGSVLDRGISSPDSDMLSRWPSPKACFPFILKDIVEIHPQ